MRPPSSRRICRAAICDGVTVVVRQADSADHGDIVAAMQDGEVTVKRLRRESGRVWLMPHNSAYEPIPGEEATTLGKVVTVLRLPLSRRRNCFEHGAEGDQARLGVSPAPPEQSASARTVGRPRARV